MTTLQEVRFSYYRNGESFEFNQVAKAEFAKCEHPLFVHFVQVHSEKQSAFDDELKNMKFTPR